MRVVVRASLDALKTSKFWEVIMTKSLDVTKATTRDTATHKLLSLQRASRR